uniref:Uncharacterized protein LOC105649936 n=1 Tax=Rhizophora mucronata TaxID=61149 RepID=A0A2P2JLE2_RHIMU
MDNVAAIVVPLEHIGKFPKERCLEEGGIYCSTPEAKEFMLKESASYITPNVVHLEHADRLTTRFDRLLVEGKHGNLGCYYLFENLDDKLDMLQAQNHYQEDYSYELSYALPQSLNDHYGGHLNLYNDRNLCLYVGMAVDGAKDQCVNPESFANFLNFLESIPFHEADTNNGSTEFGMHNMRYVLKKRFGRGSYGEVWLAFYWNCQKDGNDSSCINSNVESSSYSSTHQCNTGSLDDSLFILKRIMVERGAAVYLSGLREKYFGEVFLNASRCLGGLCDGITTILEEPQTDTTELSEMNDSVYGFGNSWNFENLSPNKYRLQRAANEEGLDHIVRYVESFESRSNEIWLVFRHEGLSLSKLMYTMEEVESNADEEKAEELKQVQILRPSKWWHWLKTTEAGKEEMRNIIWQLLLALKSCHDRNITHGDIKPENMVICFEDKVTGRCLKRGPTENKNYTTKMRIIDFGSAINEFTLKHLYGSTGPSRAEQTFEYAPPEAFLNASWYQGPTRTTLKYVVFPFSYVQLSPTCGLELCFARYDMWSVGVVILELILGSPNVFQISALTRALLDPHIEGWNDDLKQLAYK